MRDVEIEGEGSDSDFEISKNDYDDVHDENEMFNVDEPLVSESNIHGTTGAQMNKNFEDLTEFSDESDDDTEELDRLYESDDEGVKYPEFNVETDFNRSIEFKDGLDLLAMRC